MIYTKYINTSYEIAPAELTSAIGIHTVEEYLYWSFYGKELQQMEFLDNLELEKKKIYKRLF